MHMADPLISPAVGAAMWAASGALTTLSARKVRTALDDRMVPLMGVLGAFVFAAQMINFAIPGTGSSGHLGGGLLLAILLGPYAGFLAIASVLTVQALFFADGGLLALGCNIFNLGFFPCFVAYPLFRRLAGSDPSRGRLGTAALAAAVVTLQLGALGVVLETRASGISSLPLSPFLLLMQPIHLAIGIVEGLVTAAVVGFVRQARPEVMELAQARPVGRFPLRPLVGALAVAAVVTAVGLSWLASSRPDGLEWALARVTGQAEMPQPAEPVHDALAAVQARTALLPDYDFKPAEGVPPSITTAGVGLPLAGLVGAGLTLGLVAGCGLLLRRRKVDG